MSCFFPGMITWDFLPSPSSLLDSQDPDLILISSTKRTGKELQHVLLQNNVCIIDVECFVKGTECDLTERNESVSWGVGGKEGCGLYGGGSD